MYFWQFIATQMFVIALGFLCNRLFPRYPLQAAFVVTLVVGLAVEIVSYRITGQQTGIGITGFATGYGWYFIQRENQAARKPLEEPWNRFLDSVAQTKPFRPFRRLWLWCSTTLPRMVIMGVDIIARTLWVVGLIGLYYLAAIYGFTLLTALSLGLFVLVTLTCLVAMKEN